MPSSYVKLNLSDTVTDWFYSHFGGTANLSNTVNELLTMMMEEAEVEDAMEVEDVLRMMREKLA